MSLEEFVTFRKYITPSFVTIIYLLGALFTTVIALLVMYEGATIPCSFGICLGSFYGVLGFASLVFGNLAWRLLCEYVVVQFRIYDELRSINRKLGKSR